MQSVRITDEMANIRVQNVIIAYMVPVRIQHSIVMNVVLMNLIKDLLLVQHGASTACGMMQKMYHSHLGHL